MRLIFAAVFATVVLTASAPTQVCAQASCRQKCMDAENACLARTGNKGQCGNRAKDCTDKCK